MTKFTNVIVRKPGKSLCNGITSAPELGQPIYERAVEEHDDYIAALKQCGVEVTELPALEEYPDSCFVEDPAVITRCGAIITNPGAASRNGEKDEIEPTIRQFFDDEHVKHIVAPGTLDGGDVMMVGDHFYVGRSARTNEEGIRQFIEILEGWGLEGSEVPLEEVLHLKTGVNYLEDGNMLVSGEFIEKPDFAQYNKVIVPEDEAYGANCIWVNGTVIVPEGYPTVLKAVQDARLQDACGGHFRIPQGGRRPVLPVAALLISCRLAKRKIKILNVPLQFATYFCDEVRRASFRAADDHPQVKRNA